MREQVKYIAVSALSHDGLVRDHNEDSLVVGPWTLCASVTRGPQMFLLRLDTPVVVAVADGLGGHPAGEVASSIVVQELARLGGHLDDEDAVRAVVQHVNRLVYESMQADDDRLMMGTTVAGVVIGPERTRVFNVGDSRVYAVTDGSLRRLSTDDSPPLEPGQTTTHIVTETIGGHPAYRAVKVHVSTEPTAGFSRLLVCSDGLSDVVDEDAMGALLRANRDGTAAAFALWRGALEGGGPDNITLAVVDLDVDLDADRDVDDDEGRAERPR